MSETKTTVPTFTKRGFVTSPKDIIAQGFKYYVLSEKSQNSLYGNNTHSLSYDCNEDHTDVTSVISKMRNSLELLYADHFKEVLVQVDLNTPDESIVDIKLYVEVTTHDDKQVTLSDSLVANPIISKTLLTLINK